MTIALLVTALVLVPSTGAVKVPQVPAVSGRTDTPREAVPLGDPGRWIRHEDYPSSAVMDQTEGAVSFQLKVDPQGRVSECVVTISSGVPVLDDTACNLITLRAVFDPARDKKGKPVWGTYSNRVVWKMNDRKPLPKPMETQTSFIVEADGSVSGCVLKVPGLAGEELEKAKRSCAKGTFEPYVDENGEPVRRRFRVTTKIEVDPVE
jgi:TonB family protein